MKKKKILWDDHIHELLAQRATLYCSHLGGANDGERGIGEQNSSERLTNDSHVVRSLTKTFQQCVEQDESLIKVTRQKNRLYILDIHSL